MAETQSKPTGGTSTSRTPVQTREAPLADRTPDTRDETRPDGLPVEIPMEDGRVDPTPGDPRTEPVATATQSHVAGRVGPRTIPEDALAPWSNPGDELDEVLPGTVRADTPEGTGPVPGAAVADPQGSYLAALSEELERADPVKRQGPLQRDAELERRARERATEVRRA